MGEGGELDFKYRIVLLNFMSITNSNTMVLSQNFQNSPFHPVDTKKLLLTHKSLVDFIVREIAYGPYGPYICMSRKKSFGKVTCW